MGDNFGTVFFEFKVRSAMPCLIFAIGVLVDTQPAHS